VISFKTKKRLSFAAKPFSLKTFIEYEVKRPGFTAKSLPDNLNHLPYEYEEVRLHSQTSSNLKLRTGRENILSQL